MTELAALTAIARLAEAHVGPVALVFLRVGAVMALLPALGEASVPVRIRLVLTLAFTATVYPVVAGRLPEDPAPVDAGVEVLAGLLLGMALRLMVLALQMAGAMAAQAASLSQLFATAGADPQPAIGTLFTVTALALAVQAGLHVDAARLLVASYDLLPAGSMPDGGRAADWGTAQVARAFGLAFSLAAPFVIAGMVWNLGLGVMNRAMPHLMVSFIAAPALSLGVLALLALSAPFILSVWTAALRATLGDPLAMP
jgi:flagellar biosynthetic protein FliR